MRPINSKALAAFATIMVTLFGGYGVVKYRERRTLVRSVQALERRNAWHILVYDGENHSLDLANNSLSFVNTQPTSTPCGIGMASMKPNGERVVFSETSCSHFDSLISVDLVARKRKELLKLPAIRGPRWSPLGDSIAFGGKRDESSANSSLFIYNTTDGSVSVLVDGQLKGGNFLLSWSPDGRRIVFQSGSDEIRIIDIGTGESRAIDTGYFPTWSPSGSYITYRSDTTRHVLYDVRTNQKTFILKGGSVSGGLVWSPDSRYVVYSKLSSSLFSWVSDALSAIDSYGDLYVLDVQSRVEARLYRHSGSLYATDWGKLESESRAAASNP
jgi:Tol biopolymer transport system component